MAKNFNKKNKKKFNNSLPIQAESIEDANKKPVGIPDLIAVNDFADRLKLPVTKVISGLIKLGVLATINETIDFDTAAIVGAELGFEIVPEEKKEKEEKVVVKEIDKKNLQPRPPVVTIMGHVDHGKTTLLDKIREAHVAESESGGITQHITAYQVQLEDPKNKNLARRTITFIDTPGHAAFSAMREHGAAITDIVVLIVAATDGVMPQTKEVIEQIKTNKVPVIVAINKIDMPGADVMKTKQQLTEEELVPEEWGGKTTMVEISAKEGTNVDQLLEMILLQADLMELKADPSEPASGVVIESHVETGTGPTAIVLIESGTLRKADPISIGSVYGKIKRIENFRGQQIDQAGPSEPVRISGLRSLPEFGERMLVYSGEKEAKESASKSEKYLTHINIATAKKMENEDGSAMPVLNLVIKSDVRGSMEALKKSVAEIKSDEVGVKIVMDGVGNISESDITLARATNSIVLGFRVTISGAAKRMAEKEGVIIERYQVIYELIDFIKAKASELLPPEIIEEELGKGTVLAIFRDDKKGFVAGGKLRDGEIHLHDEIKFFQGATEKYRSKINTLRKEKSEVREITSAGTEFGFGVSQGANVSVGDSFVVFKTISKPRKIE